MIANLFAGRWTISRLRSLLEEQPRLPLLPPLGDPAWTRAALKPLVRSLAGPVRKLAQRECSKPLPALTDALYASFRKTGLRLPFERVYFERRRRLARAGISLLLCSPDDPWRERLVRSFAAKFEAVFEEVSWALPAHVNWHNGDVSGKEPRQIDLFCAETANLMAECLDLFGAVLSPDLKKRVRARLLRDVFENYAENAFHWTEVTHNWNAVCHQGVLGAALSQLDDADLLARMLAKARKSLPLFLSGFARDGGCSEGPGYWNYGFGWFAVLNEQIETRTGGKLSLIEGDAHARRIARFGPRVSLAGGMVANFSDNLARAGLRASAVSYLGRRLRDAECRRAAAEAYLLLSRDGIALDSERCDLFTLGRLFLEAPVETDPEAGKALPAEAYFPDLAVLVSHHVDKRGRRWDFAAKAGHNDEHHNHNDCGSWLLNVDGVRLVAEIGAPEYVKDFFGPKRYEFFAARSLGHSVPLVAGKEQSPGRAFRSRVLSRRQDAARTSLSIDLTEAYPKEAGCRRLLRLFAFDKKEERLRVEDRFTLAVPDPVESAVISLAPIRIVRGRAEIKAGGLSLRIVPEPGTRLARVESHSFNNREGVPSTAYRLVLVPVRRSKAVRIGFVCRLAGRSAS